MDKEYLIWLAGFWEGEGSCGYYPDKKGGVGRITFTVNQKERQSLQEIHDFFGYGAVSCGRKGTSKECYAYFTSSNSAMYILELLLPFMRTDRKIKQAEDAIKNWKCRKLEVSKNNTVKNREY